MSGFNTVKNDKEESQRSSRAYVVTFLFGLAIGVAGVLFFKSDDVFATVKSYDSFEIFADVLSLVEESYVEEVGSKELIEGAINGMLKSLDPHSGYLTPEMYKEMRVETEGEFGGLGIEITVQDGWLTVVTPMEDTPAWRAGLKPGDKIIKVDGEPTMDMSLMQAVRKMRGKIGAPVTITVMREGFNEPKDYNIVRGKIHVVSVKSEMMPDKFGYVRIRSFSKDTSKEMREAITKLQKEGMQGLVLDLRNNPGGLLNQAVEVSEYFLREGELIVYTKGRIPNQNMRFTVKNPSGYGEYPMVVLVNQGSASASEIVAGSLQDLKRAVVVGATSFGKGSVQTIIPLRVNAGLRLTTARYYTPSGRQIQGVGIIPDIIEEKRWVEESADGNGKDKSLNIIREKDLKNHLKPIGTNGKKGDNKGSSKAPVRKLIDLKRDLQLQRAIGVLKSWEIIKDVEMRQSERRKAS